jgi:hypothetical protein
LQSIVALHLKETTIPARRYTKRPGELAENGCKGNAGKLGYRSPSRTRVDRLMDAHSIAFDFDGIFAKPYTKTSMRFITKRAYLQN